MAGQDAFNVEGLITEVRTERTCLVRLANGHELLAFVTGRDSRRTPVKLVAGGIVKLQLSPYDLSEGRVLVTE